MKVYLTRIESSYVKEEMKGKLNSNQRRRRERDGNGVDEQGEVKITSVMMNVH